MYTKIDKFAIGVCFVASSLAPLNASAAPRVEGASIDAVREALSRQSTTSHALVVAYLRRIARIDRAGPRLNSVLAINPDALSQADRLDQERLRGISRGPLHGIPVLIKDNIETADRTPTTAGSLALQDNFAARDAFLVGQLRAAGAIILGKTNLSEWANFRSSRSSSGWSAVGGLTRNPHAPERSACGSSAGSAAAVAASLAPGAIGTETDGSITCPAAMNGVVGLKPTVGLVSRSGVVPISPAQDTAGPIAKSVRDVALLLTAMAARDPADARTLAAPLQPVDYAANLSRDALRGHRVGVLRFAVNSGPATARVFEEALDDLRRAGATLVEIPALDGHEQMGSDETTALRAEFRAAINEYLAGTPTTVVTRSLADLITFNIAHAAVEMRWFGQDTFEAAERTGGIRDPQYAAARAKAFRLAGPDGIDRLLRDYDVDVLVAPTTGPAWTSDLVNGDHFGGGGAGSLAAIAGYPHLTVPMGTVENLPVGISFIGAAWSDDHIIAFGYAYEQTSRRFHAPALTRRFRGMALAHLQPIASGAVTR